MEKHSISTVALEHYTSGVLQSLQEFFSEYGIGEITEQLHQNSYYCLNPGEAKSLSAEKMATMQHDAGGIMNGIVKIHEAYSNYKEVEKLNGN